MTSSEERYNVEYDLTNCDEEPLRFIRSCQDHARIMIFSRKDLRLMACSKNCSTLYAQSEKNSLGSTMEEVLPIDIYSDIITVCELPDPEVNNPITFNRLMADGSVRKENVLVHFQGDYLILEFERRDETLVDDQFMLSVDRSLQRIQACRNLEDTFNTTVEEVKKLTGYDRVWLYEFDEEYNGEVIAEVREPGLPSYLRLKYPHTDIPRQARELFISQQFRHIVSSRQDSDSLLIAQEGFTIDLGKAQNRGVSPIHLEYLRAMGVGASMSIAIVINGRLWGLLACHHQTEKLVDYRLRNIVGFFGRVVSGHIAMQQSAAFRQSLLRTSVIRSELVRRMNDKSDIREALLDETLHLREMMQAGGVAVILNNEYYFIGDCPTVEETKALIIFLADKKATNWQTNILYQIFPPARDFTNPPAGILSIRLSQDPAEYIIWFRPETIHTVEWGGKPEHRKIVEGGGVRLHPELSFRKWEESVKDTAIPWERHEVDAAMALRNDIKEVILLKFQEVNKLNIRLVDAYDEMESFSYTVSHDLKAPLRSIKGYAQVLLEDYSSLLDDKGLSALDIIVTNVGKMNQFINDILEMSRLGRSEIKVQEVDIRSLVEDVWQDIIGTETPRLRIELDLAVTHIKGGHLQLKHIFLNLLSNAVKYSRKIDHPWVKISSYEEEQEVVLIVADNGIGFNTKYAANIFSVFNRLVSDKDYEGSGIGLAIVKKMIDKHGWAIKVDSKPLVGTTFTIRLPKAP